MPTILQAPGSRRGVFYALIFFQLNVRTKVESIQTRTEWAMTMKKWVHETEYLEITQNVLRTLQTSRSLLEEYSTRLLFK